MLLVPSTPYDLFIEIIIFNFMEKNETIKLDTVWLVIFEGSNFRGI